MRAPMVMEEGFLLEMKALYQRGELNSELPSMRSVGYRQAWMYLDGDYDLEAMRKKAIVATRRLAKRQLTWLRSEIGLTTLSAEQYDIHDICHKIRSHLA